MPKEKKPIELRVTRTEGMPDGIVLEFVKNHPSKKQTDEVTMQALRAFWLPLALRWSGQCDSQALKEAAIEAVLELEKQAEYIRQVMGIEARLPHYGQGQKAIVPRVAPPIENDNISNHKASKKKRVEADEEDEESDIETPWHALDLATASELDPRQ